MRSQILIDALVRQTTVCIARLSTAEGTRSPLGHIANEVFTGLVAELENQAVSKKVIADMFGMALRSYRQKVQRMGESATSQGVTLWRAVQIYLGKHGPTARLDIIQAFQRDEESSVRGILNDLAESGFVIRSGRGEETTYRMATEEELLDFGAVVDGQPGQSLAALVWLQIYRLGPTDINKLAQHVAVSREELDEAVASLLAEGRIECDNTAGVKLYSADQLLIPLGETAGWEAAVVDHHRAVLNAITAKIVAGKRQSKNSDEVGGTTLTFNLYPGHPKEAQVRQLLATMRAAVLPLWQEVAEHNKQNPIKDPYQVHFYCGQYLVEEDTVP